MRIKEKFVLSGAVWKLSFSTLIKNPVLLFPLAIAGLIKGVVLVFLYYYSRKPLSYLFAPLLKYFQRDFYLHYPANFILMAKLEYYMNIAIGIIFVSFLAGWMIYLINSQLRKAPLQLAQGLKITFFHYLSLMAVWIIVSIIAIGMFRSQSILLRKYFSIYSSFFGLKPGQISQLLIFINLLLASIIETIFAYAAPSIIIEKRSFFRSLKRSFGLLKSLFLSTFILIFVPSLLGVPVSLLKYNLTRLMVKFFPEITLIILGLGIVVVFIVDSIVLTSVTMLFILNKETES